MIDPSSALYYRWLYLISLAVLYNLLMIIGRSVFWKLQNMSVMSWIIIDYIFDFVYLLDMVVNARTGNACDVL